jgi:hypothetical protein
MKRHILIFVVVFSTFSSCIFSMDQQSPGTIDLFNKANELSCCNNTLKETVSDCIRTSQLLMNALPTDEITPSCGLSNGAYAIVAIGCAIFNACKKHDD